MRLCRSSGGKIDDRGHRDTNDDEHGDREGILGIGNRQGAQRGSEKKVQYDATEECCRNGRPEAPDESRGDDEGHEKHGFGRQPVEIGCDQQQHTQQERAEDTHRESGDPSPVAESGGRPNFVLVLAGLIVRDDVYVYVTRFCNDKFADARTQNGRDAAPTARADKDLRGVLGTGKIEDRGCHVVADDRMKRAAHVFGHRLQTMKLTGRDADKAIAPGDEQGQPLAAAYA